MISNADRNRLKKTARIQAVAMGTLGIVLVCANSLVGMVGAILGLILMIAAVVFAVKGPEYGEAYLARQATNQQRTVAGTVEEFKDDKRGIVWVWIVAILAWGIMAIAYFSLSMVIYMVLDNAEAFIPWGSAPAWADQYMQTITLTRNVTAWFLIIMTVGILGWALISSARHVGDTGPAY